MTQNLHAPTELGSSPSIFGRIALRSARPAIAPAAPGDLLQPVLVAACGRSGSTAMMALLGTAPQVAMAREYPFEHRYLSRLAKSAALLERWSRGIGFSDEQVYDFEDSAGLNVLGHQKETALLRECLPQHLKARETIVRQWRLLSPRLRGLAADGKLYAEKVPAWLPALVRRCFPAFALYLFRDPRDVFLSANKFMKQRNYFGFGRRPEDTDLDHARNLAHDYLGYYENYRADCQRPQTVLVTYRELVQHPDRLAKRLSRLFDVQIAPGAAPSEFLGIHRTTASLDESLGRWKNERLAPQIVALFERQLREPMAALGYDFAQPRASDPADCDFTQSHAQKSAIARVDSSQGHLTPAGADGLQITIRGDDFNFSLPNIEPFDAGRVQEIWMSVRGDVGEHCSVYWRDGDHGFSEERAIHVPHYGGTHWRVVRFRVGQHPLWKGQIVELRVDPLNGECPTAPETGHLRWVRLVA